MLEFFKAFQSSKMIPNFFIITRKFSKITTLYSQDYSMEYQSIEYVKVISKGMHKGAFYRAMEEEDQFKMSHQ